MDKKDIAIEVDNITKKFRVYQDRGYSLKELALSSKRRKYEERPVLKGISFTVKKGEAIGLIGQNGCGKSTTLKMLSGIIYPDSGTIKMNGRVSSLIELGAGFHPDMSGRENIYINASIFGLTRKEINSRLDDIIAFSELEEFIDNPVRTYSSGMYMRLAFSVAINVDADILLIDEILAVGDQAFQQKCFDRLKQIKAEGTTIVIVSHSMGQIEQICDRSIWINDGKIVAEGNPRDIDPQYLDFLGERSAAEAKKEEKRQKDKEDKENQQQDNADETENNDAKSVPPIKKDRWGNGKARITNIILKNEKGEEASGFKTCSAMSIEIDYKVNMPVKEVSFGIGIFRDDGIQCYGTNTRIDNLEKFDLNHDGKCIVNITSLNLLPGGYTLDIAIEAGMGEPVDYYTHAKKFQMYSNVQDVGVSRQEHRWEISNN